MIASHLEAQTGSLHKMAARLAPDQNHQTIDFNGDALGTVKIMQLVSPFNKIDWTLVTGSVAVYLGGNAPTNYTPTGNTDTDAPHLGNPDFILTDQTPGPIYFPAKQHRAIAFMAIKRSAGNTLPTGRIHVENY